MLKEYQIRLIGNVENTHCLVQERLIHTLNSVKPADLSMLNVGKTRYPSKPMGTAGKGFLKARVPSGANITVSKQENDF